MEQNFEMFSRDIGTGYTKMTLCEETRKYLTTVECADLLSRSPAAIRNLVLRRKIPFRKAGGRLVFIQEEIESWIEKAPGLSLQELKE